MGRPEGLLAVLLSSTIFVSCVARMLRMLSLGSLFTADLLLDGSKPNPGQCDLTAAFYQWRPQWCIIISRPNSSLSTPYFRRAFLVPMVSP